MKKRPHLKYIDQNLEDKLIQEKINTDLKGVIRCSAEFESDINYISKLLKDKSKTIDKQKNKMPNVLKSYKIR